MVGTRMAWRVGAALLAAVSVLTGCSLDQEDALRSDLGRWLHLDETRYFRSKGSCTAAVFSLSKAELKETRPVAVASVDAALRRIAQNKAVRFVMVGLSPHQISQVIMREDLARGIGLLSSGVGPAMSCLEDWVSNGVYAVLTSPDTQMIYDPAENAVLLVYPPDPLAVYLRGNV